MKNSGLLVKTKTLEREMKYRGELLLTYRIDYPHFTGAENFMAVMSVNCFYSRRARSYQRHLERVLYPQAVRQYRFSQEKGFPTRAWEATEEFKVTEETDCIVSMYMDRYEYTGGAHGNTVESAQTWLLPKGEPVSLHGLFACPRKESMEYLFRIIEAQIKSQPEIYFENAGELARKNFNKQNFYCTPRGLVVYYQLYDIAPYSSGIRRFRIPYTGCIRNPSALCREPAARRKKQR